MHTLYEHRQPQLSGHGMPSPCAFPHTLGLWLYTLIIFASYTETRIGKGTLGKPPLSWRSKALYLNLTCLCKSFLRIWLRGRVILFSLASSRLPGQIQTHIRIIIFYVLACTNKLTL